MWNQLPVGKTHGVNNPSLPQTAAAPGLGSGGVGGIVMASLADFFFFFLSVEFQKQNMNSLLGTNACTPNFVCES